MNKLLTKSDFETESHLPDWLIKAFNHWTYTIGNSQFPCHFGVKAEREGHLRYTYCENDDLSELPQTLTHFIELSRANPNPSIRHALVLFVQPEQQAHDFQYYNSYFWNILSYLHLHDRIEWPDYISMDPHDSNWEFVFYGEPIFVSGNAPIYENRITRNLGDCLILIFQPRRIFADLSSSSTHGKKAGEIIRTKVEKIEKIPYHPDLGGYEDPQKREWKQYLITDDIYPVRGSCPMRNVLISKNKNREQ